MLLQDFVSHFKFTDTPSQLPELARHQFMPTENPRLFTISFSASFNFKIERMVHINNVQQTDINKTIDAIYDKLEIRLAEIKASQVIPYFVDCRVSISIRHEETPRVAF